MTELAEICERAARAGGEKLLEWRGRFDVREKGPKDLVTQADLASQEAIREVVAKAFPDHDFLGEEEEDALARQREAGGSEFRWIVDPLDGTTNYVHQVPHFAVSVAVERGTELLAGVVLDPVADECFLAEKGGGARLNGRELKVSSATSLAEALAAGSFASRVEPGSPEIARFVALLPRTRGLRRGGSAALNLAYVAAGRYDVYWASTTKAWDVAAGVLLVSEAGGVVTALDGQPFDLRRPKFLAAATPELHRETLEVFAALGDG